MSIWGLLMISVGVAMDAFAVAMAKGLTMEKNSLKNAIIVALYFGVFQSIMPAFGFFSGVSFGNIINRFSGIITFALLTFVGVNMMKEATEKNEKIDNDFSFASMALLALATSIDAFAVGITFVFIEADVLLAIFLMGIITFILSFAGVALGNIFSEKFEKYAKVLGGIILIIIGIKSLF